LKQLQSLVLFLVLSTITYGQFPVQPSPTGSVNTLQRNAGAYEVGRGIVITNFIDTTAANNVSYMKGTPYIEIRTSDNKIWRRNATATQWFQLGGSGTGIDSTAHYTITQQSDSLYALFEKRNGGKDTLTFLGIPSGSGGSAWSLTGNAINPATDFIGTTSNHALNFKANNLNSGTISASSTTFGYNINTGTSNALFGTEVLKIASSPLQNSLFGYRIGVNSTSMNYTTAMGYAALALSTTANSDVAIGWGALAKNRHGYLNVGVGVAVNNWNLTPIGDTLIGNTWVGSYSAERQRTGRYNAFFGYNAGRYSTSASRSVFLGPFAGENENGDDLLYIANTNTTTPLIKGNFAASTLDINGTLKVTGGSPAIGKVFTSIDANGTGSWENPVGSGGIDTTSLSNRINTKLNLSDTATMLAPYSRVGVTSFGKNATRDSTILLLSNGTRFAAKDSVGSGGGSGSIDYTTEGYGIKVDSSDRVYTVKVDTIVIGSKTYVNNKVTQVVSDSIKKFTVGVGLELTNDTLLSLKQVTVDEIGGVSNEQTTIWDNSEPDLGVPSVNGYVLSSTTAGDRSWVAQSGGSTDTTSLSNRINTKQATLVSGTNIKTINGESLLGSSDIVISGGSGIDDNPEIKLLQGLGSQIKAQTFNAVEATTTTGLVDGTARFNPVYLAKGQTITGVEYYQTTQGVYTSDNNNQVALYTVNAATGVLTRVAVSNNDGTNIWKQAANVTYKVPFSSPYVATAGVYYIGLLYNTSAQSTQPFILAKSAANNPAQAALDNTGSLTKSMTAFAQTALATTYTASGLTTAATNPWVAIY
jgi:hypothetical protein